MRSINQIRGDFKAFADAHYQINTFAWGELSELYKGKDQILHSVLNVALVSSTIRKQTVEYTLQVSVADLVDLDERNENDVESDTHRLIRDVDTFLRSRAFRTYYLLNEVGTPSQFRVQVGPEYVYGWSINVVFRVVDQKNDCSVPLNGLDLTSEPNLTQCQILLNQLTEGQKNTCILPTYDFSDATNVQPNVTAQQQTDLIDWLDPKNIITELVYNANSTDEIEDTSVSSNLAGTYTSEVLTNVDTVQYEIDTGGGYSVETLPFTLAAGDGFKVTITRTTAGQESIVEITGTYS